MSELRWIPLPSGEYKMGSGLPGQAYTLLVCYDGAALEAWSNDPDNQYDDGSPRHVEEIGIGDYRLCQRTTTPQPTPMPVPDWSQAPAWAQWWARDCNGKAHWFEREPSWIELDGEWGLPVKWNVMVDDSFDGHTTLQQRTTTPRPTPAQGDGAPDDVLHWLDVVTTAILERQEQYSPTVGIAASALVDWMLEQRTTTPQPMPTPDWSKAPEWAMWWALEPDGNINWHKNEPQVVFFYWFSEGRMQRVVGGFIAIPIGIDWRTLKQQRPPAPRAAHVP